MFFETKNLSFSYYKKPLCLKDVNISLGQGEKTVFAASQDMGKTTLLKVLSTFETSYFGKILLNGQDLKQMQDAEKNFSLILSDPVVFKNKTLKQNLDYFCEVNNLGLLSDEQVATILKEWEIEKQPSDKMLKLSLFEKKKFAIARALLKSPLIIFLDDQFENLNECEQAKMVDIYAKLLNNNDLTIIAAISESAFKLIFGENKKTCFDKFFYLCDSVVREYKDEKEFLAKRENLDVIKFENNLKMIEVELFFENNKYKIALNDNDVAVLDETLYAALDVLKLENFESESCVIVICEKDYRENLTARGLVQMLLISKAFLYSKLGGEKLI